MVKITFLDAPDIAITVPLEDTSYMLRFTYNINGFWTMHIWDHNAVPLATNIKMVPMFPLLYNKHCFGVPRGEFVVVTKEQSLDRDCFKDGRAVLVYVTEDECNTIRQNLQTDSWSGWQLWREFPS